MISIWCLDCASSTLCLRIRKSYTQFIHRGARATTVQPTMDFRRFHSLLAHQILISNVYYAVAEAILPLNRNGIEKENRNYKIGFHFFLVDSHRVDCGVMLALHAIARVYYLLLVFVVIIMNIVVIPVTFVTIHSTSIVLLVVVEMMADLSPSLVSASLSLSLLPIVH